MHVCVCVCKGHATDVDWQWHRCSTAVAWIQNMNFILAPNENCTCSHLEWLWLSVCGCITSSPNYKYIHVHHTDLASQKTWITSLFNVLLSQDLHPPFHSVCQQTKHILNLGVIKANGKCCLYVKNGVHLAFQGISTLIVRANNTLHVMLHMNNLKLVALKVLFQWHSGCTEIAILASEMSLLMLDIGERGVSSRELWVLTPITWEITWEITHITWYKLGNKIWNEGWSQHECAIQSNLDYPNFDYLNTSII